jgi:hypothetical protein
VTYGQGQEHSEQLLRATAQHQRLAREVEEQQLQRSMEHEEALNKLAMQHDAAMAQVCPRLPVLSAH